MSAAVLGLGGASGGDDAVGLRVAEELPGAHTGDASDLIALLGDHTLVVLVDAVLGSSPGRVHVLSEQQLSAHPAVSSHALSVPAAVQLARVLHPEGGELVIVGIEIAPPAPGFALSSQVAAAIPVALEQVQSVLEAHHA